MHSKKGSTAEREVLRLIVAWWRRVEPEIEITRTPGSGGWRHAATWGAKADLMVRGAPRFPFAIEVKRRERWSPANAFKGRASPIWKWWAKTVEDARVIGPDRIPMLWVRRNREPWLVLLPAEFYRERVARGSVLRGRRIKPPVPAVEWGTVQALPFEVPTPIGFTHPVILDVNPAFFALVSGA